MTHENNTATKATAVGETPLAPIDPQVARFVSALGEARARHPDGDGLTHAQMRQIAEEVRAPWRSGGPVMAQSRDFSVPTASGAMRARVHRPVAGSDARPTLLYLHGGGWTLFSIDTHDRIMRELAARSGATVLGLDYPLSPEARFPFALEQIQGALHWLQANGSGLGIDMQRLAIGGDSAGANLSVGTSLMLRDQGRAQWLKGMLLIYGCFSRESSEQALNGYGAEGNLLCASEMAMFWGNYLAKAEDALNPLASPLRAASLAELPPAFLVSAQCDVLAEQSTAFAARLQQAGVAAELREYAGATHSFLEAVEIADVAGRALDDSATWLRNCLDI